MANTNSPPWPCDAIHDSAAPSGYGCGISSVLSATSRAPASRCTAGASASVKGRSVRRRVVITAGLYGDEEVADAMRDLARRRNDSIVLGGIDQRAECAERVAAIRRLANQRNRIESLRDERLLHGRSRFGRRGTQERPHHLTQMPLLEVVRALLRASPSETRAAVEEAL